MMVYTETRGAGRIRKHYRVYTYRKDGKVVHRRVYLGAGISGKELRRREKLADARLIHPLNALLTGNERALLSEIRGKHLAKHPATFENRYEVFASEFTHDSTGIEGNTLTLRETAAVLFEGASPSKSLREVYEVLNHKKAFDYILNYKGGVTKGFLCELQRIVTENTLKHAIAGQAGRYRDVPVFIRGADITPPPAEIVPHEMKSLLSWYGKNRKKLHPVVLAAYLHSAFEAIHPFADGNGRTGRLLLNFVLHRNGYPMVSIPRSQRIMYFGVLAAAQKGNLKPFIGFLIRLLKRTEKSI